MVVMRSRGGPDLHQPSQLVKNSQPRWGVGGAGGLEMLGWFPNFYPVLNSEVSPYIFYISVPRVNFDH